MSQAWHTYKLHATTTLRTEASDIFADIILIDKLYTTMYLARLYYRSRTLVATFPYLVPASLSDNYVAQALCTISNALLARARVFRRHLQGKVATCILKQVFRRVECVDCASSVKYEYLVRVTDEIEPVGNRNHGGCLEVLSNDLHEA